MSESIRERDFGYLIYNYHRIGKDFIKIQDFLDSGFYVVQCDASHNYNTKRGSASVIIKTPSGKEYKPRNFTFKSIGPVYAEIKSIVYGIREVQKIKMEANKVLVLNDNYYAINFVAGNLTPQKDHIKEVITEVENMLKKRDDLDIQFGLVRSKVNRKADKIAKRTLKTKEMEIDERINRRIRKIKERMKQAEKFKEYKIEGNKVKIKHPSSSFWFEVSFDSYPSCNCHWWKHNWENKGEKIIKARALPCVHMCKAAEVLGVNIFDIFRKQIFRRD